MTATTPQLRCLCPVCVASAWFGWIVDSAHAAAAAAVKPPAPKP
jgi:hypothetical protein